MPELPEVETLRRQLAPALRGLRIEEAEVGDPRFVAPARPAEFEARLAGRTILDFTRRGKYFLAQLDNGATLVMHLRMTGNLLLIDEDTPAPAHKRAEFWLADPRGRAAGSLVFNDPRRFGTAAIFADAAELDSYLDSRLGPEPFGDDFGARYLRDHCRGRKTPIKAVLLDQRTVAGIGNIYADEALFRAEIRPQRSAGRLTRAEAERLVEGVRDALNAGIDAKGATIDDFRDAYGAKGSFQDQFLVHRREGLPCPVCGTTVKKIRCAGRGTYFCPKCQPA